MEKGGISKKSHVNLRSDLRRSLRSKYEELCERLIEERNKNGFWTGELSLSALATAVAIVALKINGLEKDKYAVEKGLSWLCRNINPDGGYGDTRNSISNVSTTLLCYAAINFCNDSRNCDEQIASMEKWLSGKGITTDPTSITKTVLKFYGKDYTFSIPILSMLVVCGVIPPAAARQIPKLPFELTLLPSSVYRFLNMRVVSYALPALIGVGIFLHKQSKMYGYFSGNFREKFVKPAIRKLDSLLPESGGFLEATPLTGFVVMCLISSGETGNSTVSKGICFLRNQQREEGGWPIDTDLSTWVTTLSVKALGKDVFNVLGEKQVNILRDHLIKLQYKSVHPFNSANPGGWGWTNYSGSVPDADDTPGAILALLEMYAGTEAEIRSIIQGCKWLIDIQNHDGGLPTFCKGWGRLPFDKSCADLTGHAVLAMVRTSEMLKDHIEPQLYSSIRKSILKAIRYLEKHQSADGSWLPLWFGNQATPEMTNPVYGTAKVSTYLSDCMFLDIDPVIRGRIEVMVTKAEKFLVSQQNSDGSWGGSKGISGTIEETSLSICALAKNNPSECLSGLRWLAGKENFRASPIGLYFALLWYDEKLYPLIYYTEALRRFKNEPAKKRPQNNYIDA